MCEKKRKLTNTSSIIQDVRQKKRIKKKWAVVSYTASPWLRAEDGVDKSWSQQSKTN